MDWSPFGLIAQCPPAMYLERGIIPALFLAGIAGSITHCLGMCGPFVLAQVSELPNRNGKISSRDLLRYALLPYHAGRITTYAGLGALGAWLMTFFSSFESFRLTAAIMLVLAGILFLASVLAKTGFFKACATPRWITRHLDRFLRLPLLWRGYVLGLLLGFLPCGLLYAALLAATTTANPLLALAAMIAFGLGTVPALLMVAFGGRKILQLRPNWINRISFILALLNAFTLFIMAGGLIS
ncbi:MAG: sulfite exporter TauE/SafE family protein [Alphaproteobacteria bacterium]|nr:MAG: sulfite exporter TauE/SafE family protein [Alphaproteobacteria bacterium]